MQRRLIKIVMPNPVRLSLKTYHHKSHPCTVLCPGLDFALTMNIYTLPGCDLTTIFIRYDTYSR